MKKNYRSVLSSGKTYRQKEIVINKSRFIGTSYRIASEEEALDFINMIKEEHSDATHNVYAYVLGENSNIQRFSDDGEPSGTAGVPILELIKKEDLRNVVVVSTRYFGGIKLGGGGLIRAYTKSGKAGLEAGKIILMTLFKKVVIKIDYNSYGKIENYLLNEKHPVKDTKFDKNVNITLYIEDEKWEKFYGDIMDFTNGDVEIEEEGELHLPVDNGKVIF